MIEMLIIAGAAPRQEAVLSEALGRFRAQGVRVRLVCGFPLELTSLDTSSAEVYALPKVEEDARLKRLVAGVEPSRALWLVTRRDRTVRGWARSADILVSLDSLSVHTVWELAQRNLRADACQGLGPAGRAAQARLDGTARRRSAVAAATSARAGIVVRDTRQSAAVVAKRSLRATMAPAVMRSATGARFWRTVVSAPALPDRVRGGLAYQVHLRLLTVNRADQAVEVSAAAVRRMHDRRARVDLLTREAKKELGMGLVPVGLREAVTAQLALADEQLDKKSVHKAGQAVHQALRLLHHRVPQLEQAGSPMVADADGYLKPLLDSTAGQALLRQHGRATPAASTPSGRPLRLLVLARDASRDHYLDQIRQRYELAPDTELRYVRLDDDPVSERFAQERGALIEHRLGNGQATPLSKRVQAWLQPHLDWADTALVDSCAAAALVTLNDPGDTRVVVRLHNFDVTGIWAQLVDLSRVDDLVFVSDHLRDLAHATLPQLRAGRGPAEHVLAPGLDLRAHALPKPPEARFTLAVVGADTAAKDARWAVAVLRLLRAEDRRYRLLLVGDGPDSVTGTVNKRHQAELVHDLAELGSAVTYLDEVTDVPQVLTGVGVILSSSTREAFHCALVEGAASGAVPVVRDWPFLADLPHGPRTLFPADWVVETPDDAAKRILTATSSDEPWRSEGAAAADHALSTWDWAVVRRGYDELFGLTGRQG
ncbi:glycosyltransferase [Micromonospora sp. WMMD998]|uniref:glycosyltransferase n=1 Tax=Micromonospora sp. WMMD998 TaxID=3016092 RepID=UPI00249BD2A5|nr:glycosyltransferase [Micromonospora sp. WMMD998]WFE39463.1 glycosyltransferase [Micromonospora sp. WMMD998]